MTPGQPLDVASLLPLGMTLDDLYTWIAGLIVFVVVFALGRSLTERDRMAPRLRAIRERRAELRTLHTGPRRRQKTEPSDWMRRLVDRLRLLRASKRDEISRIMQQAGFRSEDAIIRYAFSRLTMPLLALAVALFAIPIEWASWSESRQLLRIGLIVVVFAMGIKLPDILLANKRSKRYHEIRRGLADTLDLLLICAEAGLSLTAALDRVAKELGNTYPEMAEELGLTSVEIGFLPDRATALKHLAERVDIAEIRSIVNVLLQTEKYGTPIAQALRVLSRDFRTERMLRAEQKAARLPAIMTVPMIVFILPTLFIVVLFPAYLKMKGVQ